ncbi:MAG: hypothetical protein L0211_08665 [Planctomycetaceae bacterium]|nr:hypothetical protein [Planctomycetaceae bacterium]
MSAVQRRLLLLVLATLMCIPGCAWFDSLRGDGFQSWNQSLGNGMRGADPAAKPSGFFTDKRSEEIEKNLGGGF